MKSKHLVLTAFVFCFSLGYSIQNQQGLPDDIKQQTQERIDKGLHLSTVIGIVDKNGTRYYSFGQKSLTDNSAPDENSLYEIASVTKPFTSTLLADLELNGKIKLNTPVKNYLPAFDKVKVKNNRLITLTDLINHTSGLPRNPSNTTTDDSNRYSDYTPEMLNEFLEGYKIRSKKKYLYSSLAYVALEQAVENKLNDTYENLLENRVLKVLGMNDTYFKVPVDKRNRLVAPYRNGKHETEIDMGQFPAGGGLISTAKDMLRFLEANLGIYSSKLDNALKYTHKQHLSYDEDTLGLAWSIMKREESGKTLYFHKGGSNGFVSFAGFNPEDQIGVVVLVNGSRWFSDLGLKILDPTYPLAQPDY
ncbi:serine hydrolase [Flavobacteriaceae bacterium R38]|nr:serine hydrolase [Flavobacteriaceae bacterium R38]